MCSRNHGTSLSGLTNVNDVLVPDFLRKMEINNVARLGTKQRRMRAGRDRLRLVLEGSLSRAI
jgi:hypothetical protein